MLSLVYCCKKEGNTCPHKEKCKRYLASEEAGERVSTLYKVMCTEKNNWVLKIPVAKEAEDYGQNSET